MQIYTNRHLLTRILYGEEVDASFLPCDYIRHFEDGTDAKVTKTSQSVVTTQHPQDMRWSSNNSEGRGGAIPSLGEIRNCHINVGTGKEFIIRELSELVVKAVGFDGTVEFDASKPDGTMRKLIDVEKLHSLSWTHKVEIEDGVQQLFEWYQDSLKN